MQKFEKHIEEIKKLVVSYSETSDLVSPRFWVDGKLTSEIKQRGNFDGLTGKDRPEIVRLKPKIISILKRKEADRLKMEEIHREQVMKQVKNGTLPIVVREVTHFVGALDMEVTENQIEADTDALIDLFGVRYNGYYTNLPPGNYTVADLPEWKKRHEIQIMMDEKIQKAKETGKPVLVKQYTADCDGSEVDCSMDKITEYVLPDGSIQRQRTHLY